MRSHGTSTGETSDRGSATPSVPAGYVPAGSATANSALRVVARFLAEPSPEGDDAYVRAEQLLAALDRDGLAIVRTDVIEDAATALRAESPWGSSDDLYEVMQRVADNLGATLSR